MGRYGAITENTTRDLRLIDGSPSLCVELAADSFGNALGNSIVGQIEYGDQPQPLSEAESFQYNEYLNSQDPGTHESVLTPEQIASESALPASTVAQQSLEAGAPADASQPVAGADTGGGTTAADAQNATATASTLNALNGAGTSQNGFTGQGVKVADSGQVFSDASYAGSPDDAVQLPEVVVTAKRESPGFFSQLESDAGQALSGIGSFLTNFGKYALGTTELALSGVYNEGVRIVGGIASIPVAAFDSVDDAVALQQSIKNTIGYTPQTEGALAIESALQPVGQFVDQKILTPLHNASEAYLGDGLTTLLSGTAQFVAESAGVVGGIGAAESVVGRLVADGADVVDAAAPAERVVPDEVSPLPREQGTYGIFGSTTPIQGTLYGQPVSSVNFETLYRGVSQSQLDDILANGGGTTTGTNIDLYNHALGSAGGGNSAYVGASQLLSPVGDRFGGAVGFATTGGTEDGYILELKNIPGFDLDSAFGQGGSESVGLTNPQPAELETAIPGTFPLSSISRIGYVTRNVAGNPVIQFKPLSFYTGN